MSRFTATAIPHEPPQARDALDVGAVFDAYETASAALDASNFAEEGLARVFTSPVVMENIGSYHITASTNFTGLPAVVPGAVILVLNGNNMEINPIGSYSTGDVYRITTYLDVEWVPNSYVGTQWIDLRFMHASTVAGVGTKIPGSLWRRKWYYGAGPNGDVGGAANAPKQGQHCSVMLESWYFGFSLWFRIWQAMAASAAGHVVTINRGTITVDRLIRTDIR